jgi:hypothetical protein
VALYGSEQFAELEIAVEQYKSRVEAFGRKNSPAKRRRGASASPADEESADLLRGISRRMDVMIKLMCEAVSASLSLVGYDSLTAR